MGTRTAKELTPGELKQLLTTVLQGIPVEELDPERVRNFIGPGKKELQEALREALFPEGKAVNFSPKVKAALKEDGFEILEIPAVGGGITLNWLYRHVEDFAHKGVPPRFWSGSDWHGDFTRNDIENIPVLAGEAAILPRVLLIPGSTEKNFAEQEEILADYSCQAQKQFGGGVEVVFPTAEMVVYFLFEYYRRTGKFVLSGRWTWTLNRFGSLRLRVGFFGRGGVVVSGWGPVDRGWDLGVLRLVVPRS